MSVQFGRWNFDGRPVGPGELKEAKAFLAPYGPDDCGSYLKGDIGILYHAFHTTKECRCETQPHITPSGVVITWDGRLDNRAELIRELGVVLAINSTDLSIVAAAYERWRTECFAKLLGDWALSIWNIRDRSLILAKDSIGTRHLYYSIEKGQVSWSTILDPLVLLPGKTFALEEEYIAGWLSFFPATHLTPYAGIHSVPPASFVLVRAGTQTVCKYWDFNPAKRVHYRSDAEYEEHFRTVFAQSVQRRLRSHSPVLAELSGGMDSSAIVCVADSLIAEQAAESPRVDTVSYYNTSEPNWNEHPYFERVEERRGRTGCHINFDSPDLYDFELANNRFAATPEFCGRCPEVEAKLGAWMLTRKNRALLSGTGGDEVTGGVPTPIPELGDLLAARRLGTLAGCLRAWALHQRKPWFHLLFEALRRFCPPAIVARPMHQRPAPWLDPQFVRRYRDAFHGYESRWKVFGAPPSFQENLATLDAMRRQLACTAAPTEILWEKRYPYLDRDLLEFLYAIPREQLVRPGQRRSLMRRALVGIVPQEILDRKRKAFVIRAPMAAVAAASSKLMEMSVSMISSSLAIVDAGRFRETISAVVRGQEVTMTALMRTLSLECWLRDVTRRNLLRASNAQQGAPRRLQKQFNRGGQRCSQLGK
jgi:asparagine synthase (glutamine-hydrolysing)